MFISYYTFFHKIKSRHFVFVHIFHAIVARVNEKLSYICSACKKQNRPSTPFSVEAGLSEKPSIIVDSHHACSTLHEISGFGGQLVPPYHPLLLLFFFSLTATVASSHEKLSVSCREHAGPLVQRAERERSLLRPVYSGTHASRELQIPSLSSWRKKETNAHKKEERNKQRQYNMNLGQMFDLKQTHTRKCPMYLMQCLTTCRYFIVTRRCKTRTKYYCEPHAMFDYIQV